MVPYDLPQVAHDMMLRFMGIDFTQLASGTVQIPSKVGNDTKPSLETTIINEEDAAKPTTTDSSTSAEQDKAMWEGKPQHFAPPVCI